MIDQVRTGFVGITADDKTITKFTSLDTLKVGIIPAVYPSNSEQREVFYQMMLGLEDYFMSCTFIHSYNI